MIDQLKKAVRRRFGPIYCSPELRSARGWLLYQCWEKYKCEQQQNGLDPKAAFEAALPTPEEVAAARAAVPVPCVRKGKIRFYGICITLLLSAVPILFSAWVCCEAAVWSGDASALPYFLWTVPCVLLITAGALLLQCTDRKVVPVLCIVAGAHALVINMFFIMMIWTGNVSYRHPHYYDYTDRISSVESIDLVRLNNFVYESSDRDCLEYTVIETLDPEQYGPILQDLADLRYLMIMDPPSLSRGSVTILIRFAPREDDLLYAFLGRTNPGKVIWNGDSYRLESYCDVAYDEWDELAERYFPDAPLR